MDDRRRAAVLVAVFVAALALVGCTRAQADAWCRVHRVECTPPPAVTTSTTVYVPPVISPTTTSTIVETLPAGPRLVVYGHSYVRGIDIPPWPNTVAANLGLPLVNRGHVGDILEMTLAIVANTTPIPVAGDVVVIEVGLNDARLYGTTAGRLPLFRTRLREAVDRLASQGATVHVATDAPINLWNDGSDNWSRGSDAALALYKQAAADEVGSTIDLSRYWDRNTMIGGDMIHPNAAGVAALAHAVEDAVS